VHLALFLLACTGAASKVDPVDSAPPTDSADGDPIDATDPTDTDTDPTDTDTDPTDSGPTDTDTTPTEPPPPPVVRFVVLGDGGEGNDAQYEVADRVGEVCAAKTDDRPGCDFALYLGDNFYDDGVDGVDDEQFEEKFELPYADLHFPFYVVLGNHDYGEWSILEYKAEYEVEYTAYSDKWTMPDRYYSFVAEHVLFLGLDTNQIMLEDLWGDAGQPDWFASELATTSADWVIAYGHHPFRSNGAHGNAGEYEGYDWLPIANGATIEAFMEEQFCGKVDLYFAGHDHNRQWLEPYCGVNLVVSGAAAKTTDLEGRGNATSFEDDTEEGFLWVEIRGDVLRGEFWNRSGTLDHAQEITR